MKMTEADSVTQPPKPPRPRVRMFAPEIFNRPKEWVKETTLYEEIIVWPAWGTDKAHGTDPYYLRMNLETRELKCDSKTGPCWPFKKTGTCRHITGLLWACRKPAKKHGRQDTQDESYFSLEKINEKEQAVYQVILDDGPISDRMIGEMLGWAVNRVTGRRNALRDAGVVADCGKQWDEATKRHVYTWIVVEPLIAEAESEGED
jgi:hypothetical protein